jgi:hypothetical protein
MYCEVRVQARWAQLLTISTVITIMTDCRRRCLLSRQVLKFFNDHFIFVL